MNLKTRYGLIAGIFVIGYYLLLYFTNPEWLFNPFFNWGSLFIYLVFMVRACQVERNSAGQKYPLKQALKTAFTVFVITNAAYYLFYYCLFKFIDPGLVDLQKQIVLDNEENIRKALGEERATQYLREMKEKDFHISLSDVLMGFSYTTIGGFLIAFLIAFLHKKE